VGGKPPFDPASQPLPRHVIKALGANDQRGGRSSFCRVRCRRCRGHAGSCGLRAEAGPVGGAGMSGRARQRARKRGRDRWVSVALCLDTPSAGLLRPARLASPRRGYDTADLRHGESPPRRICDSTRRVNCGRRKKRRKRLVGRSGGGGRGDLHAPATDYRSLRDVEGGGEGSEGGGVGCVCWRESLPVPPDACASGVGSGGGSGG